MPYAVIFCIQIHRRNVMIRNSFKLSLIAATIVSTLGATSEIDGDDLPPARPGQCFTKAFFPA